MVCMWRHFPTKVPASPRFIMTSQRLRRKYDVDTDVESKIRGHGCWKQEWHLERIETYAVESLVSNVPKAIQRNPGWALRQKNRLDLEIFHTAQIHAIRHITTQNLDLNSLNHGVCLQQLTHLWIIPSFEGKCSCLEASNGESVSRSDGSWFLLQPQVLWRYNLHTLEENS